MVAKLVEHNTHVSEVCAALIKGKADASLPQPAMLRALDQSKRALAAAFKPAVEELIALDSSLEREMLQGLLAQEPSLKLSDLIGAEAVSRFSVVSEGCLSDVRSAYEGIA